MQGNAIFSLQFTGLQFICIWFYPSLLKRRVF